jgi:hypothetical protein
MIIVLLLIPVYLLFFLLLLKIHHGASSFRFKLRYAISSMSNQNVDDKPISTKGHGYMMDLEHFDCKASK